MWLFDIGRPIRVGFQATLHAGSTGDHTSHNARCVNVIRVEGTKLFGKGSSSERESGIERESKRWGTSFAIEESSGL
jgi:hypothetical protein